MSADSSIATETGAGLRAIREVMAEQGITEVLTPRIVAKSEWEGHPAFDVAGGHVDGRLATSALQFLFPYRAKLGSAYTLGPVFRPEQNLTPNRLHEFNLIEIVAEGGTGDALSLLERILMAVGYGGDVVQIGADEARQAAGVGGDEDLNYDQQLQVVESCGGQVVVVYGISPVQEEIAVLRREDRGVFDILAPHAGEVGAGAELLTGSDAPADGEVGQALSAISQQSFALCLCFERLLQFACGAEEIASVAPARGRLKPVSVNF